MKKTGKVLGCLLPTVAGYGCQLAVVLLSSVIYSTIVTVQVLIAGIMDEAELANFLSEKMMNANYLLTVTALATFSTLVIGVLWYKKHRPEQDYGLKQVICNKKLVLATFLFGVALQIIISMCLNLIFPSLPSDMTEEYAELMEGLLGGSPFLSILVTVVLAPLAEELLFRGVTLKKAQKIMPFMAANVLQALLFGIYHGNLIQGTYAFVLGLILGFTAQYFRSIWASILLHAFVNGSAELLSLLPEAVFGTYVGILLFTAAGVVCACIAIRLYPGARKSLPEQEKKVGIKSEFTENSFDE